MTTKCPATASQEMVTQQNSLLITSSKLGKKLQFKSYEPPKSLYFTLLQEEKVNHWGFGRRGATEQRGSGGIRPFLYRSGISTACDLDHLRTPRRHASAWVVLLHKDSLVVRTASNCSQGNCIAGRQCLQHLQRVQYWGGWSMSMTDPKLPHSCGRAFPGSRHCHCSHHLHLYQQGPCLGSFPL